MIVLNDIQNIESITHFALKLKHFKSNDFNWCILFMPWYVFFTIIQSQRSQQQQRRIFLDSSIIDTWEKKFVDIQLNVAYVFNNTFYWRWKTWRTQTLRYCCFFFAELCKCVKLQTCINVYTNSIQENDIVGFVFCGFNAMKRK